MKFSDLARGSYAAVKFDENTLDQLVDLQNELELWEPTPREKLHSTIMFSRVHVPYVPNTAPFYVGESIGVDVFEHNGKRALVLLLNSDYLEDRHEYARLLGATYDFPDYKPHITLAYDIGVRAAPVLDRVIQIYATHEYVEDLDLNWKP